jgi:hypothetical protein
MYSIEIDIVDTLDIFAYSTYIDDLIMFIMPKDVDEFLIRFNNSIEGIKLEAVTKDKSGVFLDITVSISDTGVVEYDLYEKANNKHQYLHPLSMHQEHVKDNIIINQARRIRNRCSNQVKAEQHISKLKSRLEDRGYPIQKIISLTSIDTRRLRELPTDKVWNLILELPDTRPIKRRDILYLPSNVLSISKEAAFNYRRKIHLVTINSPNIGSMITRSKFRSKQTPVPDDSSQEAGTLETA